MKKTIFLSLIFACLAGVAGAKDAIKIAYVGAPQSPAANAAIRNGALDAFAQLEIRYGKKFEVEFLSAPDAEKQAKLLGKAYIDGAKGAIVMPESAAEPLAKKISSLKKNSFPTALVGTDIPSSDRFCFIGTDAEKMRAALEEQLSILSRGKKPALYIYGSFPPSGDADKKILARARELFGEGAFEKISSEIFAENIDLYSVYADRNAALIMRRDDFGEIFISPELLADTAPIRPDIDRTFAICVGALPQLAGYLERRQISACVYHDYYGWGYFAARALAEKLMDGFEPSLPARLLAPLVATPQDADSFKADWRKWIK